MAGMLILRLAAQVIVFTTIIVITRILGPEDFGRYSFLFGFLVFLSLFNVNGLNDILVREMASCPGERDVIYRNGLTLKLAAGIIALFFACSVIVFFPVTDLPAWVGCVAALTLFFSFSMGSFRLVWDVPYQIDFRMTSASVVNFSAKFVFLLLLTIWVLIKSKQYGIHPFDLPADVFTHGVIIVILLQIASELCGVGMQGGVNLRYRYPMLPSWNPGMLRFLFREVWPLAIVGALMMIYSKVNILIIQVFRGPHELGIYAAPMRMVEALYIIPTVFIAGIMPILSMVYRRSRQSFEQLAGLSYRIMIFAALPIISVVFFYAENVISLFFGDKFDESARILVVFIWIALLTFSVIILNGILIAAGRQRVLLSISIIQAVVAVVLNTVLIKIYGIDGAVWAHAVTYFTAFPAALLYKEIRYVGILWFKSVGIPVGGAVLAGLAARWLELGLAPAIIIIPLLFTIIVIAARWIRRKDIELIRELIKYKNLGSSL